MQKEHLAAKAQKAQFEQNTALQQFAGQRQDTQDTLSGLLGIGGLGLQGAQLGLKAGGVGGFAPSTAARSPNSQLAC